MTDEKDRLGDKLRKKQKAEEDRYFAEQDRKKLEKLQQQDTPAATGSCPRCGIPLLQSERHGATTEHCPHCGGIWLDKGELEAISERGDEGWATRWLRSLLPTDSKR